MKSRKPKPATPAKPLPLPIWCCRGGPMDGKATQVQGRMVLHYAYDREWRLHKFEYTPTVGFKGDDDLVVVVAGLTKREERLWKRIAPKP